MNIELLNEYRIIKWMLNCWASINLLNKNWQIEKKKMLIFIVNTYLELEER